MNKISFSAFTLESCLQFSHSARNTYNLTKNYLLQTHTDGQQLFSICCTSNNNENRSSSLGLHVKWSQVPGLDNCEQIFIHECLVEHSRLVLDLHYVQYSWPLTIKCQLRPPISAVTKNFPLFFKGPLGGSTTPAVKTMVLLFFRISLGTRTLFS